MTTSLPLTAYFLLLALFVLWGIASWKRPQFAKGMLLGVVCAAALSSLLRTIDFHEMPVWLPALPFAVIAAVLSLFAFLAWHWGQTD